MDSFFDNPERWGYESASAILIGYYQDLGKEQRIFFRSDLAISAMKDEFRYRFMGDRLSAGVKPILEAWRRDSETPP